MEKSMGKDADPGSIRNEYDQGLPLRKRDKLFTYADYKNWPDDERWELIDGVAWNMSPAPFDVFLPEKGQNEEDINNIVQPDLAVICDKSKLNSKGCTGAPDLIVEIVSPWTSKKDLNEKFNLYERFGVKEYWVLDPGFEALQAYHLSAEMSYGDGMVYELNDVITSEILKDFSFRLADIFSDFE